MTPLESATKVLLEMAAREEEWDRVFRMLDRVTRGPWATFVA